MERNKSNTKGRIKLNKIYRDNIYRIKDPYIQRLAKAATPLHLSSDIYEIVRTEIFTILTKWVEQVFIYTSTIGRRMIGFGTTLAVIPHKYYALAEEARCRTNDKTPHCLTIPNRPFKDLLMEVLQQFTSNMRIRPDAVYALQYSLEQYIVDLFELTNKIALNAGRKTILAKDVRLAIDIFNTVNTNCQLSYGTPIVNFDEMVLNIAGGISIQFTEELQITQVLNIVGHSLVSKAIFLSGQSVARVYKDDIYYNEDEKERVSLNHLEGAVKLIIPGKLGENAVEAGTSAITTRRVEKRKLNNYEAKMGEFFVTYSGQVDRNVLVYLYAVLLYLCTELVNISSQGLSSGDTILASHVLEAIRKNPDFTTLRRNLCF